MTEEIGGVLTIGGATLRYFADGSAALAWGTHRVTTDPAGEESGAYIVAGALGYGRDVGTFCRERLIAHAVLAQLWGFSGPNWLVGGPGAVLAVAEEEGAVRLALRILNDVAAKPYAKGAVTLADALRVIVRPGR